MQGLVLEEKFRIEKKIGSGAFGEIWQAFDLRKKRAVAVKFENVDMKKQQLYYECNIYMILQADPRASNVSIPKVYFYSSCNGKNFMVMDLLGSSLEDLMKSCGGKFSVRTTLQVAIQMIDIIEFIHKNRVIH